MNDDRLRQILRKGDPAAQDTELAPDEVHAMRRTVLTAIPESHRRLAWLSLLAAGAAGVLVLALVIALGPWRRPSATPPTAPRMAATATPVPAPPAGPEPVVPLERPAKNPRRTHHHTPRLPRIPPVPPPDEPITIASLPAVREIRFSTPGGTRIIWELAAGDAR